MLDEGKSRFQVHVAVGRIRVLLGYRTEGLSFLPALDPKLLSIPRWCLARIHPQFLDARGLYHKVSCYIKHSQGLPDDGLRYYVM